jgi:hypothetical protein
VPEETIVNEPSQYQLGDRTVQSEQPLRLSLREAQIGHVAILGFDGTQRLPETDATW